MDYLFCDTKLVFDHVPTENEWKDWRNQQLNKLVSSKNGCYVAIFHDKDIRINNAGKKVLKPLHLHAVIFLKNAMTESAFRAIFKPSRPENAEPVNSIRSATRYILHMTEQAIEDGKYVYSESDLWGLVNGSTDLKDIRSFYHAKILSHKGSTETATGNEIDLCSDCEC